MKKSISVFLCLALILSSCSFVFASATSWDTSDQANLQGILRAVTSYGTSNLYYYVSQIYSLTNTISNNINTIKGYLTDSGHSIAYWVSAIDSYMSPILNAIQQTPLDLEKIWLSLGTTYNDNGSVVYRSWLEQIHAKITTSINKSRTLRALWSDGKYRETTFTAGDSYIGNIYYVLEFYGNQLAQGFQNLEENYKTTQTYTRWDTLATSTFTPVSVTTGIYEWLKNIQAPVARLSYVLASDERIEAQEAAAANEQAVVDNFIDSSGSGAASTSDFDSIAGFSSGYKSTFASDASPTGIFDIFNSNNMGWFSQETANQLDTTNSNNRTKSDNTFNTPLLDEQINSIYEQLGVKQP